MKNNRNTDQRLMTNDQQAIETPALLSVAQRSVSLRPQGHLITHYSLSGRAAHRRAGMILLLVIALLVLLALMGTVFILMASTDRKSAYASNSSASLNMAQQGVLNTVRGLMLSQTLDPTPRTLSIGGESGGVFAPDTQIARFWDTPEVGGATTSPQQFFQSPLVGGALQYAPSEPWLVSNQPYEPRSNYAPGDEVFYFDHITGAYGRATYIGAANKLNPGFPDADATDWAGTAVPTAEYATESGQTTTGIPVLSTLSPYLYDPNTGAYDIVWYLPGTAPTAVGTPIPGAGYSVQGDVPVPNASVVEPRWTYDAANNPQLYPLGTPDAMWNLLPYSDPNGTRYRFATRIIDTSSLLNLNTGWIANAYTTPAYNTNESGDPFGMYGSFISSAPILNYPGLNIDPTDYTNDLKYGAPPQIGSGTTPGRIGNYGSDAAQPEFSKFLAPSQLLPGWQNALNEYEIQYPQPFGASTYKTALFGTNSAMDLLTAGGAGNAVFSEPAYSRIATLIPNTLGLPFANSLDYFGSGYRNAYTTYSWGRDVSPVAVGTLAAGDTAPAKVALNEPLSTANIQTFSQSLYNTLIDCGYQPAHACAFLVNYLTYRYGIGSGGRGFQPATLAVAVGGSATVTAPPSSSLGSAVITVAAGTGGDTFVGNAAQPFLNETEIAVENESASGGSAQTVVGWGIELDNPFPGSAPISFGTGAGTPASGDWYLVVPGLAKPIDLGVAFPAGIPAYQAGATPTSIQVVIGGTHVAAASTAKGTAYTAAGTMAISGTILLERPGPGGTAVVVDTMPYNFSTVAPPAAAPGNIYHGDIQRDNTAEWSCDSSLSALTSPSPLIITSDPNPNPNLGIANVIASGTPGYAGGNTAVQLFDRFYSGYANTTFLSNASIDANYDLANVDDFNSIAREASYSTTTPSYLPISSQIGTNIAATPAVPTAIATAPANLGMLYVADAQAAGYPVLPPAAPAASVEASEAALYFDFAYDPRAAYTAADDTAVDPVIPAADQRPAGTQQMVPPTILSMTTLTDRSQSNTAAASALPGGAADLVRQAGKININTASQSVLFSAYSADGALLTDTAAQRLTDTSQLVADTIAFRDRLPSTTKVPLFTVPTGATTPGYPSATYAGLGFRSAADLLVAFIPTIESGTFPSAVKTPPATIQQRDAAWADVENFISVRSDTFAVYGLVQALRLNPNYISQAGAVYAATDWYNASQGVAINPAAPSRYSISTDPTNQNAEFILEGSRRFIAIVDRSYCNNGAVVQPHIVALKILPQ